MNSRVVFLCLVVFITNIQLAFAQQTAGPASIHDLFEQDQRDEQTDFDRLPPAEQRKLNADYPVRGKMQNGGVHKAQDLFEAGVVLTHSHNPEHQLLAHLAFTAAAFEGIAEAKHLAGTSLDRYLMFSGNKTSIFGTTFQIPYQHHDVSPDMNDSIRSVFCIPPLKRLNQMFEREKRGTPPPSAAQDEYWETERRGCR